MITINNLTKSYGTDLVLDNIDLELHRGKVYGFVGENGAGKTTLFQCIAGFENYSGNITSECKILKNHIGFLPTNPEFITRINGWEYLKLLCLARDIKADDFAERNIFELPLNQYIETYSTGMMKKLALMGILIQNNDIFILDEPFNGVDIHSNILISEIISELKAMNKIVLISSHIFSTLSKCSDEIRLLKNGSFDKTVMKKDFPELESEMRKFVIGDKIEKLRMK